MKATALLVLGSVTDRTLVDALFDLGFSPLVRDSMSSALSKLRSERFAAVLVDGDAIDVDVLEFVLNVRDINEHVPVVVVGRSLDESGEEVLRDHLAHLGTVVLDGSPDEVIAGLEQVLNAEHPGED